MGDRDKYFELPSQGMDGELGLLGLEQSTFCAIW